MLFFFFSNTTDRDNEPSANKEKSASDNKESKLKQKSSTNKKKSINNNSQNLDNKLSADMKSLIGEKNINQNGNTSVQEQEKAKMVGTITKKVILSNFYPYEYVNSKSEVPAVMLDLQQSE